MFNFEDPVGVWLTQTEAGVLAGRGCAAGAPGSPTFDEQANICGDVFGTVTGNSASFGFPFSDGTPGGYLTRVTVSQDAQRMTGVFGTNPDNATFTVAWLRVPDNALWLEHESIDDVDAWEGAYELQLLRDETTGGEYVPGEAYAFNYWRRTIRGDLGAYWSSEISQPADGAIQVGPVPATTPELPVSLKLELDGQGVTAVEATTASGHVYEFTATRL